MYYTDKTNGHLRTQGNELQAFLKCLVCFVTVQYTAYLLYYIRFYTLQVETTKHTDQQTDAI